MGKYIKATDFPFQPGQAVYYYAYDGPTSPISRDKMLVATVVKVGKRVTVCCEDGRRRSYEANSLVHQGYCDRCEEPAHRDASGLYCPKCHQAAVATPPPPHLVHRWFPVGHNLYPLTLYAAFVLGFPCSKSEARKFIVEMEERCLTSMLLALTGLELRQLRIWGMPYRDLKHYAVMGDPERFLTTFKAAGGRTKQQIDNVYSFLSTVLELVRSGSEDTDDDPLFPPPLRIVGDCEPDGEDETTRWLAEQMKRAA